MRGYVIRVYLRRKTVFGRGYFPFTAGNDRLTTYRKFRTMTAPTLKPEILVIGAGPGGSTAAWALAQAGHDVMLVDQAEFPRDKTCGDGLTPTAVKMLRHIDVLPQIEAAGAVRINRAGITGPFGMSRTVPFNDCMGADDAYALVLPRIKFDEIMLRHAVDVHRRGHLHAAQETEVSTDRG